MSSMEQTPQSQLKLLVAKGKEQGYLTYAEVNDHLPILLPEDDNYDTVAGYINMLFGRIPSLNETIVH